jgi:phosphate-selective porin
MALGVIVTGRPAAERNLARTLAALMVLTGGAAGQEKAAPQPLTASSRLQLTGFTQASYTWWESGADTFTLRRVRLSLAGEAARNVTFKLQFDALKSPILLDAQVDVQFLPALGLRLGQFLIPFGRESRTTSAILETVQRSQIAEKLSPGRDIGASGRDIGIAVTGKASIFEGTAAVLNGSGINRLDNNEEKDLCARLEAQPSAGFSLGVSVYDGRTSYSAGAPPQVRDRSGFDAALTLGAFLLKAEFMRGRDDRTTKDGWYVQGSYDLVPKKFQAVLKWDTYDPDADVASDRTDILTLGINWWLTSKTRVLVNYSQFDLEGTGRNNRALILQFQTGF